MLEHVLSYKQFNLMVAPKVAQNRLFAQFVSPQTDKMKSVIISSIVTESSTQGVIFATDTFGVGIDSHYVEGVN